LGYPIRECFFFAVRKLIVKEYSGIFSEEKSESELDAPRRPGSAPKASPARSWWRIINSIAGEDPLRFNEAAQLPIRTALNWVAWKKDQVKQMARKMEAKTKHKVR
jgi:hypothetical protein